jgi:alcohol dehydrogenase class IV
VTGRAWPSQDEAVDAVIARIEEIGTRIGIPTRLSQVGVDTDQLPAIVAGSRGNSMNGNPRELSDDELHDILTAML